MLPMVELTIFALGILLIDLMVPREWKWINAAGAFVGVLFAAVCVWQIQSTLPRGAVGFYTSVVVRRLAVFSYGLSLFYGLSGGTNLRDIARAVSAQSPHNPVVVIALLTTMVGLLFKIAAVPFHQWAPDAYEGAPTSITGFMSVAVKAAAWALLLRILVFGLWPLRSIYTPVIVVIAIATMTGANFAALTQTNTKRLLAYSSIAHVGYMLLAFVAMGTSQPGSPGFSDGFKGILIYLLVYTFMNLGAFAVITSLRERSVIGDEIDDMAGLYRRAPIEAVLMLRFD